MADGPSGEIAAQNAFFYPAGPHIRKHGPSGYSDYEQYRDWLRDDFSFRCVGCLKREKWGELTAAFHIDHLVPQAVAPHKKLDYGNLVYLCAQCNLIKRARTIPDPCAVSLHQCLLVCNDGSIVGLNQTGQRLIGVLRLDSPERVQYRSKMIRLFHLLKGNSHGLMEWLGYPEDLPDLRKKKAPSNSRPEGVQNCFCVLRERGDLADFY
jgi:hypothetical protein